MVTIVKDVVLLSETTFVLKIPKNWKRRFWFAQFMLSFSFGLKVRPHVPDAIQWTIFSWWLEMPWTLSQYQYKFCQKLTKIAKKRSFLWQFFAELVFQGKELLKFPNIRSRFWKTFKSCKILSLSRLDIYDTFWQMPEIRRIFYKMSKMAYFATLENLLFSIFGSDNFFHLLGGRNIHFSCIKMT